MFTEKLIMLAKIRAARESRLTVAKHRDFRDPVVPNRALRFTAEL
jgi:hypothetical protein